MNGNWKSKSHGKVCCVPQCRSKQLINRELKFYGFPNREWETERKKIWIARVHREKNWAPNKHTTICSAHFVDGKKSNDPRKENFNPTIFPWKPEKASAINRRKRVACRNEKKNLESTATSTQKELRTDFDDIDTLPVSKLSEKILKATCETSVQMEDIVFSDSEDISDLYCCQDSSKNEVSTPTVIPIKMEHCNENKLTSPSQPENVIWFTVKDEPLDIKTENDENIEHCHEGNDLNKSDKHNENCLPVKEELVQSSDGDCIPRNDGIVVHNTDKEKLNINKCIDKEVKNIIVNETLLADDIKIEPKNFVSTELVEDMNVGIKDYSIGSVMEYSNQEYTSFLDNNVASCSYTSVAGDDKESRIPLLEDNPAVKCQETNYDFNEHYLSTFGNLDTSIAEMHYQCKECQKLFSQSRYLKRHIERVHVGTKSHTCSECQKMFSEACDLCKHVNTVHRGIKNFECSKCHKMFSHYHNLCKHDRTVHKKIKSFRCPKCLKTFSEGRNVRLHISRVHQGIRNFKCNECPKSFSRPEDLKEHTDRVHKKIKNFECNECYRKFFQKKAVGRHLNNKHKDKE